jgi:preprotein translocase subunit SecG
VAPAAHAVDRELSDRLASRPDPRTPTVAFVTAILNTIIVLTCLFLICLILIQKGKGGGLAGAFGGVGGSSAFGTKAGDVFTRVTIVVASVWIFLSMILVVLYNQGRTSAWGNDTSPALSREVTPKPTKGKAATSTGAPAPAAPSGTPAAAPSGTSEKAPAAPAGVPPAIPEDAATPKSK